MNVKIISFVFISILIIFPVFIENSFSQENLIGSPRSQWKQLPDADSLMCKDGLILLQKNNSSPVCVSPTTYLKLLDRGYGKFDLSQLTKRSQMMITVLHTVLENQHLVNHWHTMMINDPKILHQSMSSLNLQLNENPQLMISILGPMITNPELRAEMINQMKENNQMMMSLQENPKWMNSVHSPIMGSMNKEMSPEIPAESDCSWCIEPKSQQFSNNSDFQHPKIMEDMIHHIWMNENLRNQMHLFMFENPEHMKTMTNHTMEPILESMMSDSNLRKQMIEMMLEHQEFMNSIRHENQFSN